MIQVCLFVFLDVFLGFGGGLFNSPVPGGGGCGGEIRERNYGYYVSS